MKLARCAGGTIWIIASDCLKAVLKVAALTPDENLPSTPGLLLRHQEPVRGRLQRTSQTGQNNDSAVAGAAFDLADVGAV